jgi:PAS domain-containing protein
MKDSILADNRFFWENLLLFITGAVLNGLFFLFFYDSRLQFFLLTELIWLIIICLISITVRSFIKRKTAQFVVMSKRVSDLEIILENIPSIVIGLDKNGGITFANKAAEKILESREAEVLKKNLSEFVISINEADMQFHTLIKSIRSIKEPIFFNDLKIESRSSNSYFINGFLCRSIIAVLPVYY